MKYPILTAENGIQVHSNVKLWLSLNFSGLWALQLLRELCILAAQFQKIHICF
jgi:hypothetical protein